VKAADPLGTVLGPEEFGWSGFFYSGFDIQASDANGWTSYPDRAAHGNMDAIPWLLSQLKANEDATGTRVLDVLSVHYYPQGGEFSDDVSRDTQLLRNRSTRSLWDPTYVDASWINDTVNLCARLKGWVSTYYPSTAVGITEYSWGADGHINGATAQADVLGILGREGIDMALRWESPDPSTPTFLAMKMFRNYDDQGAGFGETSVATSAPDPDTLSAFASVRASDGALTVIAINKSLDGSTPLTLNVANFASAGTAEVYQLTATNSIDHVAPVAVTNGSISAVLPTQSITLFVLAPAPTPTTPSTPSTPSGPVSLSSLLRNHPRDFERVPLPTPPSPGPLRQVNRASFVR
jgi:hypothetical protein